MHKQRHPGAVTVVNAPCVHNQNLRRRSGDVARLVVMGYNLDRGPLSLRAIVRDQEGGAVATFDLDLLERQPTEFARAERLLTRFAPRDLAPGEYTLDVSLDNSDGATSSGPMSFAVVSGSSR